MGCTAGYIWRFGPESFTFIYERFVGFTTAAFLMSVVQALYVYIASFQPGKLLALGGNSGNLIYDVRPTHSPSLTHPRCSSSSGAS